MGVRRLLAGMCKGIVATAALFLSTSYGPPTVIVASRDPFYPVARDRLTALVVAAERRGRNWTATAPPRQPIDPAANYRPPEPLEHDNKIRSGELLAALGKD